MADVRVPKATDIKYNKKEARKALQRKELADGLYAFGTSEAKVKVIETGELEDCLAIDTRVFPLKDPEDVNSKMQPTMYDGLILPFANPEVPGHRAPEWAAGLAYQQLNARFEDKVPDRPFKDEDGNLVWQGEIVVSADEGEDAISLKWDEIKGDIGECVFQTCLELLDDPSPMCASMFYGEVGLTKKKEGKKQSRRILNYHNSVPEDMELFDFDAAAADEEEEEVKPRRRKKTSKKKATKRR